MAASGAEAARVANTAGEGGVQPAPPEIRNQFARVLEELHAAQVAWPAEVAERRRVGAAAEAAMMQQPKYQDMQRGGGTRRKRLQRGGSLPETPADIATAISRIARIKSVIDGKFKSNIIYAITDHLKGVISVDISRAEILKNSEFTEYLDMVSQTANPTVSFDLYLGGWHTIDDWTIFDKNIETEKGDYILFTFTGTPNVKLAGFVKFTKRKPPTEANIQSELTRRAKEGIPRIVVAAHISSLRTPPNEAISKYILLFPPAEPPPDGKLCKYAVGTTFDYAGTGYNVTKITRYDDVGCTELEVVRKDTHDEYFATVSENIITSVVAKPKEGVAAGGGGGGGPPTGGKRTRKTKIRRNK